MEVEESPTSTKGDIIGFNDDTDDEHSDIDESIDHSSDEIKFLPATVDGLGKRLRKLWKELMREEKHEHRDEIVSKLDDLLRRDVITTDEYK